MLSNQLKLWLRSGTVNFFGLIVVFISWLAIAVSNYKPGTRLLAWDVMASDFNPALNVIRSATGVWQRFQGLGLLGGHGYVAQFPHAITQLLLLGVFPEELRRYVFAFLMLGLGSYGCFYLAKYILQKTFFISKPLIIAGATLSAIAYQLNLATVQTFYVHLEPFIIMYGLFPWAILLLFSILEKPNLGKWLLFFILNFFLSSIGFIPPVFISYLFFLSAILIFYLLNHFKKVFAWKVALKLFVIVLIANAYWLSSFGIFVLTQKDVYLHSKLNQYSTDEFVEMNRQFGELKSVALLKGFYFESLDQNRFGTAGNTEYIMLPWTQHLGLLYVSFLGYALFTLSAIGALFLFLAGIKKRKIVGIVGLLWLIAIALLATGTPILSQLSFPIRSIPILNQAFRIPFSKISMVVSLWYSIGIAGFTVLIAQLIGKLKIHAIPFVGQIFICLPIILIGFSLFFVGWPTFQGNFLYRGARIALPPEYKHFQTFMRKQSTTARIAVLPALTWSGWDMHQWQGQPGYTGSGFLWYNLSNPVLHRSFDVWSGFNQRYYQQLSTALYDLDAQSLARVFKQYQVEYVLIDQSIFLPGKDQSALLFPESKKMLAEIGGTLIFNEGDLFLYQLPANSNQLMYIPATFFYVSPQTNSERWDQMFALKGNYVQDLNQKSFVSYPFSYLSNENVSKKFQAEKKLQGNYDLLADEPLKLVIPPVATGSGYTTEATVSKTNDRVIFDFSPWGDLKIDQVTYPLPQLPQLEIPLQETASTSSSFTLVVADQVLSIASTSSQISQVISLPANQSIPVSLIYVPANATDAVVERVTLPSSFWSNLDHPIEIALATAPKELYFEAATHWQGVHLSDVNIDNCDATKRGEIQKNAHGNSVIYEADHSATNCAATILPLLNTKSGGLIRFQGKNIKGRGLKFYITSVDNVKAQLEWLLPKSKFDETFSLLPVKNGKSQQYSAVWETRSFGTKSSNQLDSVSTLAVDVDRLTKISIEPTVNFQQLQNNVVINKQRSFGTYLHVLEAQSQQTPGLFVIGEGYDQNWLALAFPADGPLSPLLLKHVTFNGWANSWYLPQGNWLIMVLYWPQLLSFAGLGLLSVSAIWLFLRFGSARK